MMRYRFGFILSVLLILPGLICPNLIGAKGGKGKSKEAHEKGSGVAITVGVRLFEENQIATIRAWFSNTKNLKGLPPGLAKRERLPAGLERQLKKNGSLPPGLEKRLHPFPLELEHLLPETPKGIVRVVIGVDILLLDKTSNIILDIVREVLL